MNNCVKRVSYKVIFVLYYQKEYNIWYTVFVVSISNWDWILIRIHFFSYK